MVGRSGTFTSRNFQGVTLLAGYYRSDFSDWFYAANVPLSVVQAPLWSSLAAIGAIGLVALLVSTVLAYVVGKGFARAAATWRRAPRRSARAAVAPMSTPVSGVRNDRRRMLAAERALAEREHELETVLETVPAAVWFTYDPQALQVIRNRFAAELMGLPTEGRKSFGAPDLVIDTIAMKDGHAVSREDRPLSRAMRGEQTDNEEFAYILPNGVERILLTSARPIPDAAGRIIGAVQISLDITERKRGEEQRKLLVNELNHRVKNTLAVVQSIASQTLRSATSLPEAGRSLSSRLVSLAKAHDILTQENWSGADLKELSLASCTPHAAASASSSPATRSGCRRAWRCRWRSPCTNSPPTPSNTARFRLHRAWCDLLDRRRRRGQAAAAARMARERRPAGRTSRAHGFRHEDAPADPRPRVRQRLRHIRDHRRCLRVRAGARRAGRDQQGFGRSRVEQFIIFGRRRCPSSPGSGRHLG